MRKLYFIYAWILSIFVMLTGFAEGVNWQQYSQDNLFTFQYDTESIIRLKDDKNLVQIWYKMTAKDKKAVDKTIQQMKRFEDWGLPVTGYENYSYTIGMVEFDCDKRLMRLISASHFDKDKNILNAGTNLNAEWDVVYPDSGYDGLFKAGCKQ